MLPNEHIARERGGKTRLPRPFCEELNWRQAHHGMTQSKSRDDKETDKKAGGPLRAARRKSYFSYWLGPLLAASACCIFFAISAFTASKLKLAPVCIGG